MGVIKTHSGSNLIMDMIPAQFGRASPMRFFNIFEDISLGYEQGVEGLNSNLAGMIFRSHVFERLEVSLKNSMYVRYFKFNKAMLFPRCAVRTTILLWMHATDNAWMA